MMRLNDEPHEIRSWTESPGVDEKTLKAAVPAVGRGQHDRARGRVSCRRGDLTDRGHDQPSGRAQRYLPTECGVAARHRDDDPDVGQGRIRVVKAETAPHSFRIDFRCTFFCWQQPRIFEGVPMTNAAGEIKQLKDDFRSARAKAVAAQGVVTRAFESFLAGNGAGPTAEHLGCLHSTHLADDTAGASM